LFRVFTNGRRSYIRVFPGKKRLIFSANVDADVKRGLMDTFILFRGKHVQNNFSETHFLFLTTVIYACGLKTRKIS
jgi:hypothetical protein